MTILQALLSMNVYPIPSETVERICIDRQLDSEDFYDYSISITQSWELAKADVLMYLHDAPSIVENQVGVNNAIAIKREMMDEANRIYAKWNDPKMGGITYGFIGDNWNA